MTDVDDEKMIREYEKQHFDNYINVLKEIIKINSNALVDEDISSLIKKPPLDSMDNIKSKLISLSKSLKIVLDSDNLNKLVTDYRESLLSKISFIKDRRIKELSKNVDSFIPKRKTEILQIRNGDLESINRANKKDLKSILSGEIKEMLDKVDTIYKEDTSNEIREKINTEFSKFMKKNYQKQLLENMAIKIVVKDRTLISGVAEQGERYLFTKNNSYIFKNEEKSTKK